MRLVPHAPSDLIVSVDRALTLLETVGHSLHGLTHHQMSAHCDLAPASVRHHVATLAYHGYLLRWDDARYTLGPTLTDRTHDLAIQLYTRRKTATVDGLADWLDRPTLVTRQLLRHGTKAAAGTCACIASRHRSSLNQPGGN